MPASPPRHDRTDRDAADTGGMATVVTEAVTAQDYEQLRRLLAVTDAGLAQLDVDELLAELTLRTRELMGTDTAAILLLDSSGRELVRSEEHTSELQSRENLVCRLLLEKKKINLYNPR